MYPKSGDEGQLNQKLNFQYVNFRKLSVVKNDPPHTHTNPSRCHVAVLGCMIIM